MWLMLFLIAAKKTLSISVTCLFLLIKVTVTVYKPGTEDDFQPTGAEQRTIPSDISVVIRKGPTGDPKIIRVKYGKLWVDDPYDVE